MIKTATCYHGKEITLLLFDLCIFKMRSLPFPQPVQSENRVVKSLNPSAYRGPSPSLISVPTEYTVRLIFNLSNNSGGQGKIPENLYVVQLRMITILSIENSDQQN